MEKFELALNYLESLLQGLIALVREFLRGHPVTLRMGRVRLHFQVQRAVA